MKNDNHLPTKSYSADELREEERQMRKLVRLVDFTTIVIAQGNVSLLEACSLIRLTRERVLALFPEKAEVFDLIYRPRFARIIRERLSNSPTWMN
jgi:hypothetical protein